MRQSLGEAVVEVRADTRGFDKDVADGVSSSARAMDAPAKKAGGRFSSIVGKTLKRTMIGVGGAVGGAFGVSMFKGFSRLNAIDQANAKLTGLGHSAGNVQAIMDDALAAVKGTAFGMGEAATTAAGAVAAGVKPGKELQRTLTLVGDAATIAGTDITEMGSIFNKVATSNKVQGQVIAQLQERGIPIVQLMAKELGVTAEEVLNLAKKGEIGFGTFQDAIEKGMGGAAQESGKTFSGAMANVLAAMGRAGAAALKGLFSRIPNVLENIIDKIDALTPLAERVGEFLGDAFDRAAGAVSRFVKGADFSTTGRRMEQVQRVAQKMWTAFRRLIAVVRDFIKAISPGVLTAFKTALDTTLDVLEALGDILNAVVIPALSGLTSIVGGLPGPFQALALQVGAAALLFPRLSTGIGRATTALGNASTYTQVLALEMRDATARARLFQGGLGRLGGALKGLAGPAGIGLLIAGVGQADTTMGGLMTTFGAVAAGASIGGPWGAAIGGAGGLFYTLYQNIKGTKDAAEEVQPPLVEVGDTLDQLTGKITRQTREWALNRLEQAGAIEAAGRLGIHQRDLISASLGNEKAQKRVNEAMAQARENAAGDIEAMMSLAGAQGTLKEALGSTVEEFEKQREEFLQNKAALDTWKEALQGIPKEYHTEIKALGIDPSVRKLKGLRNNLDLTPKQMDIVFRALNVDPAKRAALGLKETVESVGKAAPSMKNASASVLDGLSGIRREAEPKSTGIKRAIEERMADPKWSHHSLVQSLRTGMDSVRSTASSLGSSTGAALGAGMASGVRLTVGNVVAEARNMVLSAVNAAKEQGGIKSPSRVMAKQVGKPLVEGVAKGMKDEEKRSLARAARSLVDATKKALRGLDASGARAWLKDINRALAAHRKVARDVGKGAVYFKNVNQALGNGADRMRKFSARARQMSKDITAATNKLQRMRDTAGELRDSLRSELALGDLFTEAEGSGPNQFGFGGSDGTRRPPTFADIAGRVKQVATRARTFASLINRMRKAGIPAGLIQEVSALGSEEGIAVAQALLSGSKAQIRTLSTDWNAMTSATQSAGNQLARAMEGIGVQAQAGLVRGLQKKSDRLDKAAKTLAKRLTKALRAALKIKSPSALMADEIGVPSGEGVGVGMIQGMDEMKRAVNREVAGMLSPLSPSQTYAATLPADHSAPRLTPVASSARSGAGSVGTALTLTDEQIDRLADAVSRRTMHLDVTVGADTRTKTKWYLDGKNGAEVLR